MKRIITGIIIIIMMFCAGTAAAYADTDKSCSVKLNGTKLNAAGYDSEGTIYLPLRAIGESLGYQISWSAADHTVHMTKGTEKKSLNLDTYMISEGDHDYYGDFKKYDGRVYLSGDFFSDSLGLKVTEDSTGKLITVSNGGAKNNITIETVKDISKGEKIDITLYYPKLSGLANQKVQDTLNELFKKEANDAKQMGLAGLADFPTGYDTHYQTYFDYRVKYNSNNMLSVVFTNYQFTGGAHGSTLQTSSTFDLATGKEFAMKDLFNTGSDYGAVFNKQIKSDIKARDLYELTTFSAIATDQAYYLDSTGVTVYFQQYEYFPYAAGIQTFCIDYPDLADLLKPELKLTGGTSNQTATVLVEGKDNTLKVGDSCSVTLKGNPTTGYSWQYDIADGSIISLTNESSTPDSALIGAGSTFNWSFKALKPGKTTISFKYYRPWEGTANFLQNVEYTIIVK